MRFDTQKSEAALQNGYRECAAKYRLDDEIEITTPHHQRLARSLAAITSSFGRPISVLDVGCGTGRYFYCLRNVKRLVGMDISSEMLIAAESPVNGDKVSARNIQLIRGNIFLASFPPASFDFIYSLGMFGHGCPVTSEVCDKFHHWLKPDGQLYFDVIDVAGLPWQDRIRFQARELVYSIVPNRVQAVLDGRSNGTPFFGLAKNNLERLLRSSRFSRFTVSSHVCESPLWQGRHLECHAAVSTFEPSTQFQNNDDDEGDLCTSASA